MEKFLVRFEFTEENVRHFREVEDLAGESPDLVSAVERLGISIAEILQDFADPLYVFSRAILQVIDLDGLDVHLDQHNPIRNERVQDLLNAARAFVDISDEQHEQLEKSLKNG